MATKINFNLLLAQADKNTNKAQKLLEEKKLLNQKHKKNISNNKNEPIKESSVEFEKRREEIRRRNEQEARELLEKKKQKDTLNVLQTNRKSTKIKPKEVSKEAVQNFLNLNNNTTSIDNKSSNNKLVCMHGSNKINQCKKTATKITHLNLMPKMKSYNELPSSSKIIIDNLKGNSVKTEKSSLKKTETNGSFKSISYDQILKMADICHNKSKISSKTESKSTNDYSDLLYGQSKIKKSELSKKSIVKNESDELKLSKSIGKNSKKTESSKTLMTTNISNKLVSVPTTSGTSAWDRIVSDMKKKSVKKIKKIDTKIEAENDYDNEEGEYDSEMEDFIDDESCEEDLNDYKKTIHEIFKYDPKRYKNINLDDVDSMETDYHSQLKEEKISLKLGILEDMEEQRREAEEERRKLKRIEHLQIKKDNKRQKSEKN